MTPLVTSNTLLIVPSVRFPLASMRIGQAGRGGVAEANAEVARLDPAKGGRDLLACEQLMRRTCQLT